MMDAMHRTLWSSSISALSKDSVCLFHTTLSFTIVLSFFLTASLALSIGNQKLTWKDRSTMLRHSVTELEITQTLASCIVSIEIY